jgi:very-short-patch-repair endonuclease
MSTKLAARDLAVAETAARQHGVISTTQLRAAGLSKREIDARIGRGHLHRLHQGVYAVGFRGVWPERRWMAAILACRGYGGEPGDAFLSHRSAATLWGLLGPHQGLVDVAVVGENGRARQRGIRVHRPRTLDFEMTTIRRGIPVTDPTRTISDLRRASPARGGATPAQLRRAIRKATLTGVALDRSIPPDRTRSDLEQLFLELCVKHRLPPPEVNVDVGGVTVDFLWRDQSLVVETDGFRFHRGRPAFEEDRRRGLRLRTAGHEVLRLSHDQVVNESTVVVEALRKRLAAT